MARKYIMRSKEEKLAIVKAVLSGTPAQQYENEGIVDHQTIMKWVKKYQVEGEAGLEPKKNRATRYLVMNAARYLETFRHRVV